MVFSNTLSDLSYLSKHCVNEIIGNETKGFDESNGNAAHVSKIHDDFVPSYELTWYDTYGKNTFSLQG